MIAMVRDHHRQMHQKVNAAYITVSRIAARRAHTLAMIASPPAMWKTPVA